MGETIELRRVTDEEGAQPCEVLIREYVAWLCHQLWREHEVVIDAAEMEAANEAFRAEWPRLFEARGRMWLVLVEGEPAGVAALKPVDAEVCELKRMYVHPGHRGLGLGRLLLDRAVDEARALGYRSARLETFDFMHTAQSLYRSSGFVETAPYDEAEGADHGVAAFELFMSVDLTVASSRVAPDDVVVEVPGIEPGSFGDRTGLLRAQPAASSSTPAVAQARC